MRIASNEKAQRAKLLAYSLLAAFEGRANVEVVSRREQITLALDRNHC